MRKALNRAFTLVEVLIVIVILGILAALVVPQFTNPPERMEQTRLKELVKLRTSEVEELTRRRTEIERTPAEEFKVAELGQLAERIAKLQAEIDQARSKLPESTASEKPK